MNNQPIGIFDSGVGGLTIAYEVKKQLPNESFIYFGDIARNPYGTKPIEEISTFSEQITKFLISKNVKAILIACNTATIASLNNLKSKFKLPIIGVVDVAIHSAIKATKNNKIGILATERSVKSGIFQQLLKNLNTSINTISISCPKIVQLAENCILTGEEVENTIEYYLKEIKINSVDTLILGCTHFPLYTDIIQKNLRDGVVIINSAHNTVKLLSNTLKSKNIESNNNKSSYHFYSSASDNKSFEILTNKLFKKKYEIKFVDIKDY